MNVRIVPRGQPQRTDLYGGIQRLTSDGRLLMLWRLPLRYSIDVGFGPPVTFVSDSGLERYVPGAVLPLVDVSEILMDEETGDLF